MTKPTSPQGCRSSSRGDALRPVLAEGPAEPPSREQAPKDETLATTVRASRGVRRRGLGLCTFDKGRKWQFPRTNMSRIDQRKQKDCPHLPLWHQNSPCVEGEQHVFKHLPLEKEMATHSSVPAWRIPWTEEPGGPQSTGSQSRTRLSHWAHTHAWPWG